MIWRLRNHPVGSGVPASLRQARLRTLTASQPGVEESSDSDGSDDDRSDGDQQSDESNTEDDDDDDGQSRSCDSTSQDPFMIPEYIRA